MKKINFKIIFIFIIAFCLILTGCSIDRGFEVVGFTAQDETNNIYINKYSNDTTSIPLDNIVKCNYKKAVVSYYLDEEKTQLITSGVVDLIDGDNYVYATIDFKSGNPIQLTLNFYCLKICTVKFDTDCNTKIETLYVEEDSLITPPTEQLTKQGYAFAGWDYNFNKPVSDDLIVKAKWKANSYTVTYDPNGGEVEYGNTIVTYGEQYELDVPTREGYIFLGWKYNGRYLTTEKWFIAEDITVTAVWELEERTYEIEYIIVGAVGPNLQRTYSNKEEVILRRPYKSGYQFIGWYLDGDFEGDRIYKLEAGTEGNLVLYSKWEKNKLENMKISFLGDSISTFYSSSSDVNSLYSGENQYYYPLYSSTVKTVDKTWWYQVVNQTNTILLANDSWSGSSCYNNGNENNNGAMNYNRINNLKGSDIVVVLIGTNDNVNGHSINNFTKAYNTMVKRIREVCPDAFIFCCTIGYANYTKYYYKEETRLAYNEIIREAAVNCDGEVIEISEVQTKDNYSTLLGDALHPNATGMDAYAKKVVEVIKNYLGV